MQGAKRTRALGLLAILTAGCPSTDERLVEMSRQHSERQAEQNQVLAKQSEEVVQASRELVQSDAKSRQELIAAQRDLNRELQVERTSLDRQHEELASERREIAAERNRDPIIAASIASFALLLASMLPLATAFLLLWKVLGRPADDDALTELLVTELVSEEPVLLPTAVVAPQLAGPRSLPRDTTESCTDDA